MQISDNLPSNSQTPKCETSAQSEIQAVQAIADELRSSFEDAIPRLEKPKPRQRGGSKDELRYWKNCLRSVPNSPYLYIELQREGVRKKISLETSNRAAAAHRAREVWRYVRLHGWAGYMAQYQPDRVPRGDVSVGDYLEAASKCADLSPKTLRCYGASLRKIVTDSFGLDTPRKYGNGRGRKEWLAKVDAVRLSQLTPARIQEWKRSFLSKAGQDPLSQRSAKVSVNSFLRQAKSLFSPRVVKHLGLELPDPPFSSVAFEPRQSCKYRSSVDITKLIGTARTELASADPESFKVFLLACFGGLRRREIDLLPWSAFRWDAGVIRIEATSHFSPKSEDSMGDVSLESEVMELFRGFSGSATGEFVIESDQLPNAASFNAYRCDSTFERLIAWLRAHGVSGNKPLHTLRKEFGSEVAKHYGIYAASRALRHSDISVTTQFYTEDRTRSVVGLGHLLSDKVVEFKQAS